MTTLVVGANGQIGRQFCELAQQAGAPVRAMIRNPQQQAWFAERGIDTVIADLEGDIDGAFAGCDELVFTAGSGPHTGPDKTLLIDLYGAMRCADLAVEHGMRRYTMVSAIRAEDPLAAPEKLRPYMAAKYAADVHLRHAAITHVILKPGRLTDAPPSGRISTSLDTAAGIDISRANVARALLHVVQHPELRDREYVLLDGDQPIAEALT